MHQPFLHCRALVGSLWDILRLAQAEAANPHSYTKFRVINRVRRETHSRAFIEAGTFRGTTAKRCASVFEKVYTIELDPVLARQAAEYLCTERNVTVIPGDAVSVLPDLLENPTLHSILVFLDGHYSGGVTACGDVPEPAIEELHLLTKHADKINAIVIDDFRLFGIEPGFPPKSLLLEAAERCFLDKGFEINVCFDQLLITRRAR